VDGEKNGDRRIVVEFMASDDGHGGRTDEFIVRFLDEKVERVKLQGSSADGSSVITKHIWRAVSASDWAPIGKVKVDFIGALSSKRRTAIVQIGFGDDCYLKTYNFVQLASSSETAKYECFIHSDTWERQICLHQLDICESLAGKSEDTRKLYSFV
jgi:hypothetical protein